MQSDQPLVSNESRTSDPVCPESVDELREAVSSTESQLLVTGGGTKLDFANAAGEQEVTVSSRRLNRVLQYEPADMTIAVEAGVTIDEVNRVLGEHNQMLPVDAVQAGRATLGGHFASGIGGPRRFRYGSLRDWVVGLEVMGPDGVVTKSGGMVVKNVTGYDMPRLHHGAHGAFGVITRLNLKVLPREEASRSIVLSYVNLQDAFDAAFAVLRSQWEPSAVTLARDDIWTVSVVCDGRAGAIDSQAEAISETCRSAAEADDAQVLEGSDVGLRGYSSAMDTGSNEAIARLSVPASKQPAVVQALDGLKGSHICADPGSGLIYVAGPASLEWREAIRSVSPDSVFIKLPASLKQGIDVFGPVDRQTLFILQRLKQEFDPNRRLNRGRFISGI